MKIRETAIRPRPGVVSVLKTHLGKREAGKIALDPRVINPRGKVCGVCWDMVMGRSPKHDAAFKELRIMNLTSESPLVAWYLVGNENRARFVKGLNKDDFIDLFGGLVDPHPFGKTLLVNLGTAEQFSWLLSGLAIYEEELHFERLGLHTEIRFQDIRVLLKGLKPSTPEDIQKIKSAVEMLKDSSRRLRIKELILLYWSLDLITSTPDQFAFQVKNSRSGSPSSD